MDKQSVRIGVDRFYYAVLTQDSAEGTMYDAPKHLPGVNAVTLSVNSNIGVFYADEGVFETFALEAEKKLSVAFSGLSNDVAAELTGTAYADGMKVDKKADMPPYVAVGFRTQKSNGSYRYVWIYKGRFAKADFSAYTKSGGLSPQAELYFFTAVNRICDGAWRQTADSDDENLLSGTPAEKEAALNDEQSGWFSSPNFDPSAV